MCLQTTTRRCVTSVAVGHSLLGDYRDELTMR